MRVLIVPDKFKGSFTSAEICAHLARGLREGAPGIEIDEAPMADGGEGTLEAILASTPGTLVPCRAQGPLGEWVEAAYGVTEDGIAILESARFCGLGLLGPRRPDPAGASSAGLGQAIAAVLDAGLRRFVIGLGGTATVDGGAGMARALGFRLLDRSGRALAGAAGELIALDRIDPLGARPDLGSARFLALCDVQNPLLGPDGAVAVFGPQKGVSTDLAPRLEEGLRNLAGALERWRGAEVQGLALRAGTGAAGGLGAGLAGFLRADLTPGADWILARAGIAPRMERADLVITGEGALDRQTAHGGKLVASVLRIAARAGRPAVVVTGRWDGTLPDPRPVRLQVMAGSSGGGGQALGAEALAEMGRRIAGQAL